MNKNNTEYGCATNTFDFSTKAWVEVRKNSDFSCICHRVKRTCDFNFIFPYRFSYSNDEGVQKLCICHREKNKIMASFLGFFRIQSE